MGFECHFCGRGLEEREDTAAWKVMYAADGAQI